MKRNCFATAAFTKFVFIFALATTWPLQAQDAKSPYPNMAPVDQYLMERNAEITLARTAAPESISRKPRSWSSDRRATKLLSKGRMVSCVRWKDRGGRVLTTSS